jgi:hypothetical protein
MKVFHFQGDPRYVPYYYIHDPFHSRLHTHLHPQIFVVNNTLQIHMHNRRKKRKLV